MGRMAPVPPDAAHRVRARKDAGMSAVGGVATVSPLRRHCVATAPHCSGFPVRKPRLSDLLLEGAISMSTTNELTRVYKWGALTAGVMMAMATAVALVGQAVGL